MSIKKAYEPIIAAMVAALETNPKVRLADVMEEIKALASAKAARSVEGKSAIRDASGTVVAIFDYYFKRWMPLVGEKAVEFGKKANTNTGFNTMCKEGVSLWTKQQNDATKANKQLLEDVKSGTIQATDIGARQEEIEVARKSIAPTELGFVSEDEVNAYLAANGVTLKAA